MYRGGYPEPFNDPDYEENCDDITLAEFLQMLLALAILVGIVFLYEGLVSDRGDTEFDVDKSFCIFVLTWRVPCG